MKLSCVTFKMNNNLFDDSDSNEEINIKTENPYAKHYDEWRQKEELNKIKTKFGRDVTLADLENLDEDDSSTSEEEDEDGKELTEQVEKDFYKTLACLKNKDPQIYNENVTFFSELPAEKSDEAHEKKKKAVPFTIRDQERKIILEKGGIFEDEDSSDEANVRPQSPTYVEEQQMLRESIVATVRADDVDNGNSEWGGLFQKRDKTKEEKEKEELGYREWLAGQTDNLKDKEQEAELQPLKEYWSDPKIDANEAFLRDYLLNKRFLEKEDPEYIPRYEEIVHDSDADLSEDEKNIDQQEEFEHKYNFRFEEPDHEYLKRYPRTMEHSVRQTDDRRKRKRAEVKERKTAEKERKKEELQQMKALKRKEIEAKIQKLRDITGNQEVAFQDEDIEGDFDPAAHDARMKKLFCDEFYEQDEGHIKPEFPDDDELDIENWDKWDGEGGFSGEVIDYETEPHCEDDNFNMDCDYDPTASKASTQEELIENSGARKKRKRLTKFAEALSHKKPLFDPNDNTYEQYLDEYYKLDYEDIIGDLPCRFKYREVVPNDFGLSVEEILCAKDKELNKWCSLKKAVQIRPEHIERYDVTAYKNKAKNEDLKRKTFVSLYTTEAVQPAEATVNSIVNIEKPLKLSKKQRKRASKVMINKSGKVQEDGNLSVQVVQELNQLGKKKRKLGNADFNSALEHVTNKQKLAVDGGQVCTPSGHVEINQLSNKKKKLKHIDLDASLEHVTHQQKLAVDVHMTPSEQVEINLLSKKKKKLKHIDLDASLEQVTNQQKLAVEDIQLAQKLVQVESNQPSKKKKKLKHVALNSNLEQVTNQQKLAVEDIQLAQKLVQVESNQPSKKKKKLKHVDLNSSLEQVTNQQKLAVQDIQLVQKLVQVESNQSNKKKKKLKHVDLNLSFEHVTNQENMNIVNFEKSNNSKIEQGNENFTKKIRKQAEKDGKHDKCNMSNYRSKEESLKMKSQSEKFQISNSLKNKNNPVGKKSKRKNNVNIKRLINLDVSKKNMKRKFLKLSSVQNNVNLSNERLRAYGINPKKYNKQQHNQSFVNHKKNKNKGNSKARKK